MSIYVDNVENIDKVTSSLDNDGYKTLQVKDTLIISGAVEAMKIVKLIVTCALVFVLFLI